ncbi:MAG: hypothetical protein K2G55_17065 [Lachnospiraceae bacterium]|nr:hypothetical protein [Lachnospiraceae bacterium]MDE7204230.1 hypothetical protein [Lachnospiraceae bacterium]
MQFFYIDYMNNGKKERNIGFLRVENDGISVGLRGVPLQCGDHCKVYAVNIYDERILLGEIAIKAGYGMEKMKWNDKVDFTRCMRVEIPLYGTRRGVCVLRDDYPASDSITPASEYNEIREAKHAEQTGGDELCEEIHEDKWQQLLRLYPEIHICPEAQTILIRPRDVVILSAKYHELATNSFVLHAYYNYRQLLLFRYAQSDIQYYLGVPGVYYEREQRIAQMFGFEGFENGEARMQQDADNKLYKGCFGYYMKRVEI